MAIRVTQTYGISLITVTTTNTRVTQAAVLTLVESTSITASMRATQAYVSALVKTSSVSGVRLRSRAYLLE